MAVLLAFHARRVYMEKHSCLNLVSYSSYLEYDSEFAAIIAAAVLVHAALGCGYQQGLYQEALELEFKAVSLPYERDKMFSLLYRDQPLRPYCRADFICYGAIVVQVLAQAAYSGREESQVLSLLRGFGLRQALLLNFGTAQLQYKQLAQQQALTQKKPCNT
jgi:GxxExxY protein